MIDANILSGVFLKHKLHNTICQVRFGFEKHYPQEIISSIIAKVMS